MLPLHLCPSRWRSAIVRLQSQPRHGRRAGVACSSAHVEQLEGRKLLSTFAVTNLNDAGTGSLRMVIQDANALPGGDLIDFQVAGTIQLKSGALPAITDSITIDGTTAPGFVGSPVVQVDYNGFGGLKLNIGSSGSSIQGLGLHNSSDNGVTLTGVNGDVISGNLITNNALDGVALVNSSNNLIGHSDPVTGTSYFNADQVTPPVTAWQGIRGTPVAGQYLISGTSGTNGVLYIGSIDGTSGTTYLVNYPGAKSTSVYGPDYIGQDSQGNDIIRLVGSYQPSSSSSQAGTVQGFEFQGTFADLQNSANYHAIVVPGAKYNYVHSTMGDLVVGNYDGPTATDPLGAGNAYLYNLTNSSFTDIAYPGAAGTTAYGIWYNGGTSYTICGGNLSSNAPGSAGNAYLVNYDSSTGTFSNWTSFSFPTPLGHAFETHFEGISSVQNGFFTLSADFVDTSGIGAAAMSVVRNIDGSFSPPQWTTLSYPGATVTSNNSIYGNQVVGIATVGTTVVPWQATIQSGFQLSNIINSNGANGIRLDGSSNNLIQMNNIGTDSSGNVALANMQNGILVTNQSMGNMIGGEATDGNDPTSGVYVRPPQGNLISGNGANGVLINGQSGANQLSGNFIGTSASGNSSLGNALDGVSIVNADNNSLRGVQDGQSPFVYYNVIGGNLRNGIEINSSNHTTIFANFLGLGANDQTPVPNLNDGLLVDGSSAFTVMGGNIPLGNVASANGANGVEIRDTASDFVSYNTFAGIAAFQDYTNLGNGNDGFLVTSTGGNILIRTNLISENHNDGVEITGGATGVRLAENFFGLDASGSIPLGNRNNGLEISGAANDIVLGSVLDFPSITMRNLISANLGNGIYIHGGAYNIQLEDSFIGTDFGGTLPLGNQGAGILITESSSDVTIGLPGSIRPTLISGNLGDGIVLDGAHNVTVANASIGTTNPILLLSQPLGNGGNGITIRNSSNNVIGGTAAGSSDTIAYNHASGIAIISGQRNGIHQNSIYGNILPGIDLAPSANNGQSAPILTSVVNTSTSIAVSGRLAGKESTTYVIELFASRLIDEGRYFLGSISVTTDVKGTIDFVYSGAAPPVGFDRITATATDPLNNTSEFSTPVLSGVAATQTYVSPTAPLFFAANLIVTEPAGMNVLGATVSFVNWQGEDRLAFWNRAGLQHTFTEDFTAHTAILTFTGSATAADYQTVLRSMTYQDVAGQPNTWLARVATITVSDQRQSQSATTSISVVQYLSGLATTVNFAQGSAPLPLAPNLVVTPPTGLSIQSATVSFTNWQGEDRLAFYNSLGLQHTFSQDLVAHTALLTITGTGSGAGYQTLLQSVTYQDVAGQPNTTTRAVTFTVNDGTNALSAKENITVTAVNQPPLVQVNDVTSLTYKVNAAAITIMSKALVTDPDSNNLVSMTVQISSGYQSGHDTLSFKDQLGITGSYNSVTGILTLSGNSYVGNYRQALRAVSFNTTGSGVSTATRIFTVIATDSTMVSSIPVTQTLNVTHKDAECRFAKRDRKMRYDSSVLNRHLLTTLIRSKTPEITGTTKSSTAATKPRFRYSSSSPTDRRNQSKMRGLNYRWHLRFVIDALTLPTTSLMTQRTSSEILPNCSASMLRFWQKFLTN